MKNTSECVSDDLVGIFIIPALLDRLLHHAETVLIEGKSYRMKDQIDNLKA